MDHRAGHGEAEKSPVLILAVSLVYVVFNVALLLSNPKGSREIEAYLSRRVPRTRMFPALVTSLLHPSERDPVSSASLSDSGPGASHIDDVVSRVIDRRLRRIEGLRTLLSGGGRLSLSWLGLSTVNLSATVRPMEDVDTIDTPDLGLSARQAVFAGFVKFCTQLLVAVFYARVSKYLPKAALSGKSREVWSALVVVVAVQCLVGEAACMCAKLLLHVCNREDRRRKNLAEMVVECDVPWIEPQSSDEARESAVSLLRISILQLEVAHQVIKDKDLMKAASAERQRESEDEDRERAGQKDPRIKMSTLAEADRQALLPQLHDKLLQARSMLREEYRACLALHVTLQLTGVPLLSSMHCGGGNYLLEFTENPLEHLFVYARVARYYDEYIQGAVYAGPLAFLRLICYTCFISQPTRHAYHEDLSLVSWRAVLPRAVLWVYLVALFCISLWLSYEATTEVAESRGLILAFGLAGSLVLTPLLSLLLGVMGRRLLMEMHDDLMLSHDAFRRLCVNVARIQDEIRQERGADSDIERQDPHTEQAPREAARRLSQTAPVTVSRPPVDAAGSLRNDSADALHTEEEPPPNYRDEDRGGMKVVSQEKVVDPSQLPRQPPPSSRDPALSSSSKPRRNRSHVMPVSVSPEGSYASYASGRASPSAQAPGQGGGRLYLGGGSLSSSQRGGGAGTSSPPSESRNRRSYGDSDRGLGESSNRGSLDNPEGTLTRQGERRRRQRTSERRSEAEAGEGRRSVEPLAAELPAEAYEQGTQRSGSRRHRQASRESGEEQGQQDGRGGSTRLSLRSREEAQSNDSRRSSVEEGERRERVSSTGRGGRVSEGTERRNRGGRRSRASRGAHSDDEEEPEEALEAQYV